MDIPLNQGQQDAADSFMQFLVTDETEMVISGPAGTGKSSLLGQLIRNSFKQGQQLARIIGSTELHDIRLTATTNKAADVLAQYTKREVNTIHSALELTIRNNFRTGETHLAPAGGRESDSVIVKELVVVEECSMVNLELYRYMHSRTTDCKFLYLGDHCQLAPVKERLSPVFNAGARTAHLTQVMRSINAPPITELNNNLRNTVETGKFFEMKPVPGFIEYLDNAQMLAKINEYFVQQNPFEARIGCFTNKRVNDFNKLIRKGRGLPDEIQKGERMISNTSIEVAKGSRISVEEEVQILDADYKSINFLGIDCYRLHTIYGWVTVPRKEADVKAMLAKHKKAHDWTEFFAIKEGIADFRPRDACTVYKAQGSTYDVMFVDLGDIGTCNIADQVARMLYVANSRARSKIYFFGQLPNCYRGL